MWKKFESNNKLIALNILFVPYNTEEIRLAYKSKHKRIHLLVIQCLQVVHLMQQKISLIVREVKILWKDFVKT